MLSIPMLKQNIKANFWYAVGFLFIMMGVVCLYWMGPSLLREIPNWLWEGIFWLVPILYAAIMADRLIGKQIAHGTMAYYLAYGYSRKQVIWTQGYCLMAGVFLIYTLLLVGGLVCLPFFGTGEIERSSYLLGILSMFCMQVFISGITFFFFAVLPGRKNAWIAWGFFAIISNLLHAVLKLNLDMDFFQYFSLGILFEIETVIEQNAMMIWTMPVLVIMGGVCYLGGMKLFEKRDLPL